LLKVGDDGTIETIPMVYAAWFNPMWMHSYGGTLYDEAGSKITANDPTNVTCWEWLSEYYLSFGDIDQLTAFAQRPGFFDAGNPFSTNQCAYILDGFWLYESLDTHSPDINYGVAYWPTLGGTDAEKANWQIGGWHYSIPKGVPNPDAGWDFLRYTFVDNSGKMGCDTLNGPGVIAQFPNWISCLQDKMGADNRMAPYLRIFTEQSEVATKQFPVIENQSFYTDELTRTFDLVLRKQMTPQDALDEVTKTVQADLDRIRAEAG
jgi:maltose-binding protein MalE